MLLFMVIWILPGIISYYCWHNKMRYNNAGS
jgi:hypothetical protein